MADLQSISEESLASPPLIGARLGLAALRRVLEAHAAWLEGRPDGLRASLQGIVLAEATLDSVNLERADLKSSNFIDARLSGANLNGAVLQYADFSNATLIDADLSKADFTGALVGCFHWRQSVLDMPINVFKHDDGVVDHETDGDGQTHQRQVVERVAQPIHQGKGA